MSSARWAMLGLVVSAVVGFVTHGFAIKWLWAWFIVPLGMSPLTVAHAYGLSLLVSLLTVGSTKSDGEDWDANRVATKVLTDDVVVPALCLVMGWVVRSFM